MRSTQEGCKFNKEGEIVPIDVYIVWGAPGSGKTTYVKKNKEQGDLVVDLDLIRQAISLGDKGEIPYDLLNIAKSVRDHIYELVKKRKVKCNNVWIVAGVPTQKEREELKERVKATKLIHIDTPRYTCIERIKEDKRRKDKRVETAIVMRYFRRYERPPIERE